MEPGEMEVVDRRIGGQADEDDEVARDAAEVCGEGFEPREAAQCVVGECAEHRGDRHGDREGAHPPAPVGERLDQGGAPGPEPELDVVDQGDVVYVNYTGFLLNGKVFDTTDNDVATDFRVEKDNDTWQPRSIYEPAPFHPGSGELVQGFEDGFANMRAGETKAFFVHEDKAYSRYEEETLNLTESIPLTEDWKANDFQRASVRKAFKQA